MMLRMFNGTQTSPSSPDRPLVLVNQHSAIRLSRRGGGGVKWRRRRGLCPPEITRLTIEIFYTSMVPHSRGLYSISFIGPKRKGRRGGGLGQGGERGGSRRGTGGGEGLLELGKGEFSWK